MSGRRGKLSGSTSRGSSPQVMSLSGLGPLGPLGPMASTPGTPGPFQSTSSVDRPYMASTTSSSQRRLRSTRSPQGPRMGRSNSLQSTSLVAPGPVRRASEVLLLREGSISTASAWSEGAKVKKETSVGDEGRKATWEERWGGGVDRRDGERSGRTMHLHAVFFVE